MRKQGIEVIKSNIFLSFSFFFLVWIWGPSFHKSCGIKKKNLHFEIQMGAFFYLEFFLVDSDLVHVMCHTILLQG